MASKKDTPPSLPDDLILYEIFPRLPAKSIHRFRCVSTSFRRLPSDPLFLAAARRRHYFLSLTRPYIEQGGRSLYSLNQSGVAREIPRSTVNDLCTHASIVNGLLLTVTAHGRYKYTVSNADMDETFELPQLPSTTARLFFYFCHDPKTDTYKVLRAVFAYNSPLPMWKFKIITLGSDSSWRGYQLEKYKQLGDSKSVCVNGTLYLTRFCRENDSVICAFIVGSEKIYPVSYPAGLSPSKYDECHLIEMEGALAVVEIVKDFKKCEIKLWRLGDDLVSWTELRIGFDPRWEMTFRRSSSYSFSTNDEGEIVMGVTGWSSKDGCWIFTYNVGKGEWTRSVEIQGVHNQRVIDISLVVDQENIVENPLPLKSVWDRITQKKHAC